MAPRALFAETAPIARVSFSMSPSFASSVAASMPSGVSSSVAA
jgi:hypothetical protein